MPRVDRIEQRIFDIEGFRVRILHPNGRDVRADFDLPVHYTRYERQAWDSNTVSQWKTNRFNSTFVGFDVEVLDGAGQSVPGQTRLSTVRGSY